MAAVCRIGLDTHRLETKFGGLTRPSLPIRTVSFISTVARSTRHASSPYDYAELSRLPCIVTEPFAGEGSPFKKSRLPPSVTVLDVGSGAGMECLSPASTSAPARRTLSLWHVELQIDSRFTRANFS